MPLDDTEIMFKFQNLETAKEVQKMTIEKLEKSDDLLWASVDKIRESVSGLKVDVGKTVTFIGIVQTVITAVIVWWATHKVGGAQ